MAPLEDPGVQVPTTVVEEEYRAVSAVCTELVEGLSALLRWKAWVTTFPLIHSQLNLSRL
jgi:hypothetical protein